MPPSSQERGETAFLLESGVRLPACVLAPQTHPSAQLSKITNSGIISFMTTKQRIETALIEAMRNRQEAHKRALRMLLSSIKLAEVEKGGPLDEAGLAIILQKEIKTRREAIEEANRAGRPDLIRAAEEEIEVLASFLPEALSEEELRGLAQAAIAESGATSAADMGKVMKILMPRVQGRAPGDQVSKVVRELLQKNAAV